MRAAATGRPSLGQSVGRTPAAAAVLLRSVVLLPRAAADTVWLASVYVWWCGVMCVWIARSMHKKRHISARPFLADEQRIRYASQGRRLLRPENNENQSSTRTDATRYTQSVAYCFDLSRPPVDYTTQDTTYLLHVPRSDGAPPASGADRGRGGACSRGHDNDEGHDERAAQVRTPGQVLFRGVAGIPRRTVD